MAKAQDSQKRSYVLMMLITLVAILASFFAIREGVFGHRIKQQEVQEENKTGQKLQATKKKSSSEDLAEAKPFSPASALEEGEEAQSQKPLETEQLSYEQAQFITLSNGRYTAVFSERGAVLSVYRFIDKDGESYFKRTPINPMEKPEKPLLLLGPRRSLASWVWSGEERIPANQEYADNVYPEQIAREDPRFTKFWDESSPAAFAFLGPEAWRNQVRWQPGEVISKPEMSSIRFTSPADKNGLVVTKHFKVYPEFKIVCELEFHNTGAQEREVFPHLYGPVGIRQELLDDAQAGVMGLYEQGKGLVFKQYQTTFQEIDSFLEDLNEEEGSDKSSKNYAQAHKLYEVEAGQHVVMNALSNGYFIAGIGADSLSDRGQGLVGSDIIRYRNPQGEDFNADEINTALTYNLPEFSLAPDKKVKRRVTLYAGPRSRRHLNQALLVDQPDNDQVALPEWKELTQTGWGWIQPLALPITLLLDWLRSNVGSTGIAIILLTFIVRLCLSPLSIRGQRAMQIHASKMGKIKPKLDEVRKKYEGNKGQEARMMQFQETRAIMKAHKVSMLPLSGCLPLLLQMPIFVALYDSVRTSFLLRHETFLWIRDLSRPDALFGALESHLWFISSQGFLTLNLLPLIWVALVLVQQAKQPKATDPQQANMQRQMKFVMVLMGLFWYSMPAGFVLYFVTSSLYTLVESRLVKFFLLKKGLIDPSPGVAVSGSGL